MIKIGLDLAYRSCGVAVITEDKLLYTSNDLSKDKEHCSIVIHHMTEWVFKQIQPYISLGATSDHILVMEDIFKGRWETLKNIARVQGAVMDRYISITGKQPQLIDAVTARNRVNLSPQSPKVAIQLWALDTFKIGKTIDKVYLKKINETVENYYSIKKSKKKGDSKRLKLIEKDLDSQTVKVAQITGLDNHMSDAIILAQGAVL